MPATLPRIDQPAAPRVIPSVPLAAGGDHVDVTLRVIEPGSVGLSPYPFSEPSFEVAVPSTWLEDRRYDSAEEAARAYHDAATETITISLSEA